MPTDNTDSVSVDFRKTDSISGPSSTKLYWLTRMKWLGSATWHVGGRLFTATVCTSMLAAAPVDVGQLSSLHVSDRQGWWWSHLAVDCCW